MLIINKSNSISNCIKHCLPPCLPSPGVTTVLSVVCVISDISYVDTTLNRGGIYTPYPVLQLVFFTDQDTVDTFLCQHRQINFICFNINRIFWHVDAFYSTNLSTEGQLGFF